MNINFHTQISNFSKLPVSQNNIKNGLRKIKVELKKSDLDNEQSEALSKEKIAEYNNKYTDNSLKSVVYRERTGEITTKSEKLDDILRSVQYMRQRGVESDKKATDYEWDSFDDFEDEGLLNFLNTVKACAEGTFGTSVGDTYSVDSISSDAASDLASLKNSISANPSLTVYRAEEGAANREEFINKVSPLNEKSLAELVSYYYSYQLDPNPTDTVYGFDIKEAYKKATGNEMIDIPQYKLGFGADEIAKYENSLSAETLGIANATTFEEYLENITTAKESLLEMSKKLIDMQQYHADEANKYKSMLNSDIDSKA